MRLGREEDERCNRYGGCAGILFYDRNGDCSCHIFPPCFNCVEAKLTCPNCGWDETMTDDEYEKEELEEAKRKYTGYGLDVCPRCKGKKFIMVDILSGSTIACEYCTPPKTETLAWPKNDEEKEAEYIFRQLLKQKGLA